MDSHEANVPTVPDPDGGGTLPHPGPRRWRLPDHRIRICKLDECQANGGRDLTEAIELRLGISVDERTADGSISFEALECVGMCGIGQSVTIDDEPVVGRDTVLRAVDRLLA